MVENTSERTLFIGNKHANVTQELLHELFIQAGPIENVVTPKEKTFAFVTYKHVESVPYAINIMNNVQLFGRTLTIKPRTSNQTGNQQMGPGIGFLPHPSMGPGILPPKNIFPQDQESEEFKTPRSSDRGGNHNHGSERGSDHHRRHDRDGERERDRERNRDRDHDRERDRDRNRDRNRDRSSSRDSRDRGNYQQGNQQFMSPPFNPGSPDLRNNSMNRSQSWPSQSPQQLMGFPIFQGQNMASPQDFDDKRNRVLQKQQSVMNMYQQNQKQRYSPYGNNGNGNRNDSQQPWHRGSHRR